MSRLETKKIGNLTNLITQGVRVDEILDMAKLWLRGDNPADVTEGTGALMTEESIKTWLKANLLQFYDSMDYLGPIQGPLLFSEPFDYSGPVQGDLLFEEPFDNA